MKYFIIILFTVVLNHLKAQTITVNIAGIRSDSGQILIGVYMSDNAFQNQEPIKRITVPKTDIKDGKLTALIKGLRPGTYGFALMDDEDMDRLMKYKFFLPSEGFGFSNYYHSGILKVHFDDFKFNLDLKDKVIEMKLRYL